MEMYGLEAVEQVEVRGGTGGGVFLQVVMQDETTEKKKKEGMTVYVYVDYFLSGGH